MKIAQIHNLSKSYSDTQALKNISLEVEQGELFGLIGPDGAGKTTLFRILVSLLLPDKGEVFLLGKDVKKDFKELRQHIGYMPGRFSLYEDLTVEENLYFYATVFGTTIQENYHLIKDIYQQIEMFKTRRAGKLSGGMKQKLALCCALIHNPEVIVLDEPTTGVDAVSRKEFWDMLKSLKKQGITVLVSTPYMDEASMCDRVALIQKGELLSVAPPAQIESEFEGDLFEIKADNLHSLKNKLNEKYGEHSAHLFGQSIHFSNPNQEISEQELSDLIEQEGFHPSSIKKIKAGIEDCFMHLMTAKKGIE
ncbi:MAG: ABC transporter ATP-binding protein [Bacteroidales bacterium]|nr:ABC transporter ATP-binding protein [Bacteroidales bacterium]MCF8455235.1 ABC transporter ATP-binding protein [Bacteroidales bacterium]